MSGMQELSSGERRSMTGRSSRLLVDGLVRNVIYWLYASRTVSAL